MYFNYITIIGFKTLSKEQDDSSTEIDNVLQRQNLSSTDLSSQAKETILQATQDVFLEKGSVNYNNLHFLIIGHHPDYPKKRTLVQFEDIPSDCVRLLSAKMYLWHWYSHKASWHSSEQVPHLEHTFRVHQVKKEWNEAQATSTYRLSGIPWSEPYLALDGTDTDGDYLDKVYFPSPPPATDTDKWIEFDITAAAQDWMSGQPNYGVLIWSDRENDNGRDVRFYSRERSTNKPYLKIQYTHA